jgi:hypothetical protein
MAIRYVKLGDFDLFDYLSKPIKFHGGNWDVSQEGIASLETGAYQKSPKGTYADFEVTFYDELVAAQFRAYCVLNEKEVDLKFFTRDKAWYYRVWGVNLEHADPIPGPRGFLIWRYAVICYLHSPFALATLGTRWIAANASLPQTSAPMNNNMGHYEASIESLAITCHYDSGHTKALTLTNQDGDAIILVTEALTNEVWELQGNAKKLSETYTDPITSSTIWDQDTVGDGTFDTDHIELDNAESAYYVLNSPHPVNGTIKMTADLSLDSGGATNEALVEISDDGEAWEEALNQDDLIAGSAEYTLEAQYMTVVIVRFTCSSGTSGKYLNIGSIKFEAERWIEPGTIPVVDIGASKTFTLSCNEASGDLVSIDGTFRARRKLI